MQDRDAGKPRSKREITTHARRRHIVETAAICFVEQGFHQTSVRDIAMRAGISLGNLYNHFDTKTALIAEIATLESDDLRDMRAALAMAGDPQVMVDQFIDSYFTYVSRPENAVLTAEITAEAMRSPQIAQPYLDNHAALADSISAVLERMTHDAPHPDVLAQTLLDLTAAAAGRVAFESAATKARTCATTKAIILRLLQAST